jgi:signal transduction histidine kinase
MCAGFIIVKQFMTVDLRILQLYRISVMAPITFIPFWVFRKRFWQNVFLLFMAWLYGPISLGFGMYVGHNWLHSEAHPHLVVIIASFAAIALTLPPLLLILRRLHENLDVKQTEVWRVIWLLPASYFVLFLFTSEPFHEAGFKAPGFLIIRVYIYCIMLLTCYLLKTSLRRISENTRLKEAASAIEGQLAMQKEHYRQLMRDSETVKAMRHDLRHHLVIFRRFAESGDSGRIKEYIDDLNESLAAAHDKSYCENQTVAAITAHYLCLAESEGVSVEARLDIPEDTGRVPAMDLCVIMGNFLENALEAYRLVTCGEKFIHVRSKIDGDRLSIIVDNSFDGICREEGPETRGMGLPSAKAVCEKHKGLIRIDINGKTWKSSALVHMAEG